MMRRAWSTAGLATLLTAAVLSTAPPALADDGASVDQLVEQAVEVSTLPVDEAALTQAFSSMTEAQALELINTQLVAETTTTTEVLPADATARATVRTKGTPTINAVTAAAGCWTAKHNRQNKAAAGNVLFTYFTTGGWCSNGSSVTSVRLVERGGETSTPGWRYGGVGTGGQGIYGGQGRVYTQFKFFLGIGGFDVQSPTPCSRVRGNASGSHTGDGVCSVS